MILLHVYVDNKFDRTVLMPAVPDRLDRLVFKCDPYKGYMVYSREFYEDKIIIKTNLDT